MSLKCSFNGFVSFFCCFFFALLCFTYGLYSIDGCSSNSKIFLSFLYIWLSLCACGLVIFSFKKKIVSLLLWGGICLDIIAAMEIFLSLVFHSKLFFLKIAHFCLANFDDLLINCTSIALLPDFIILSPPSSYRLLNVAISSLERSVKANKRTLTIPSSIRPFQLAIWSRH